MNIDLGRVQKILGWIKSQVYLDAMSSNAKARFVKRGQVYRCNFGYGVGSEIQKERPAIIIQNNPSNKSSGNTIVVPVTHDTSNMMCMVPITAQYDTTGNVILDGQANTSNLMCVSKARLGEYICDISSSDLKKIDESLAKMIGLMEYYSDIKIKYEKKLQYIENLRTARNKIENELEAIRKELGISKKDSILNAVIELKNNEKS